MKAKLAILLAAVAVLAAPSDAPAGGIDDQPCPNVAGENTNTCPAGTVGTPYVIRFVEREGSGCGPSRQTFHLDSGIAPPGMTLLRNGILSGTPAQAGVFRFYVEMREPADDPEHCAGERTQKQFTLPIRKQVSILSGSSGPLRAEVGARFRATLRAVGGTGVFRWIVVGGNLPAGVRLAATGVLLGTPRSTGTYRFTLSARDTEKRSATWSATLRVARDVARGRLPHGIGRGP